MEFGEEDADFLTELEKYGPPDGSEARRRYAALEPDRLRQLELLAQSAPTPRLRARVAEGLEFQRSHQRAGNLITASLSNPIVESFIARFPDRLLRDPRMILFRSSKEDEVVAVESEYSDGSSLVLISDALFSMCSYLASINTFWLRWCRSRGEDENLDDVSIREYERSEEAASSVVCVRYWVLQQRLFGVGGQFALDLTEDEYDRTIMFARAAQTFILAHEAAHFVLGHGLRRSISLHEEAGQTHSESIEREEEADRVAMEVTPLALLDSYSGMVPELALAGVAIALDAIGIVERGLFVRVSDSHPDIKRRRDRLFSTAGPPRRSALTWAFGASLAAEYGEEFTRPLGDETWKLGSSYRGLFADHPTTEYRMQMAQLDRLHATEPVAIAEGLVTRWNHDQADLRDAGILLRRARLRTPFGIGASMSSKANSFGVRRH